MKKTTVLILMYAVVFAVGVTLLACEQLGGAPFVAYTGVITVAALALHGFDRLKEVGFSGLKLVLAEARDIRNDIYAKAEEVRSVMVDLADSYIASAVEAGGLSCGGIPELRDMLAKRERARALLSRAGLSSAEIGSKLQKVTGAVGWLLIGAVRDRAQKEERMRGFEREHGGRRPFLEWSGEDDPELNRSLEGKDGTDAVRVMQDYIRGKGLSVDDFEEDLRLLGYFLDHETLPESTG